mgnify:CR=1 FL=1
MLFRSIQKFMKRFLLEGKNLRERNYISEFIKNTLNMNDEEYVEFVKANANKSFKDIEPKEAGEKLIKAFASTTSVTRAAEREYNEMFISNPKPPMAVFVYSADKTIPVNNPIEYLKRDKTSEYEQNIDRRRGIYIDSIKDKVAFLREYAIENDIPFVVFGD